MFFSSFVQNPKVQWPFPNFFVKKLPLYLTTLLNTLFLKSPHPWCLWHMQSGSHSSSQTAPLCITPLSSSTSKLWGSPKLNSLSYSFVHLQSCLCKASLPITLQIIPSLTSFDLSLKMFFFQKPSEYFHLHVLFSSLEKPTFSKYNSSGFPVSFPKIHLCNFFTDPTICPGNKAQYHIFISNLSIVCPFKMII